MRIVIILCLCPAPRKVLAPETPGGPTPEGRQPELRLQHEPLPPRNPWHPGIPGTPKPPGAPLPQGNTPPPNFACNSPTPLSNFESTSLKFRGFLDIPNWSDDRIACEIDGELRWLTPTLRRIARSTLPRPADELARTDIETSIISRSVDEHSRHNRRIVMACAHLRR